MSKRAKLLTICLFLFCSLLAYLNATGFNIKYTLAVDNSETFSEINTSFTNVINETNPVIQSKSSLYVVGDIMLGRDVEKKMLKYGSDYPYRKIQFNKDDSYTLANFESSIPNVHVPTPDNTFKFSVNEDYLPDLSRAGITHVSLANNHAFDYGLAGYNNTVTKLWDNNFVPFGHPSILSTSSVSLLRIKDTNIAIISIHTLFGTPEDSLLKNILTHAATISDLQIVYIHWGDEYSLNQSDVQRRLAEKLSASGADIIIGHHPHVVQGIEKINNTLVFYSLGNFIFDQYFSENVQNGLVLKFTNENSPAIELLPVTSDASKAQPQLIVGSQKSYFLEQLAVRSDEGLAEEIKFGLISLDFTLASSTEVAIMAE